MPDHLGKEHVRLGLRPVQTQHGPLFYAHVAGEKDPWYGDKSQSTLWQENKPAANRIHPTAKPVELVERALLNSSKAGDIVADLFGGSGSTLIGCERRGRKARLMEIDPKYADWILRRFEEYTGNQATRFTVGSASPTSTRRTAAPGARPLAKLLPDSSTGPVPPQPRR